MHQVGLAHTHPAIEEKRVVAARGVRGDGLRRRMGELIAGSHHEGTEGEFRIQRARAADRRPPARPPAVVWLDVLRSGCGS